MQAPPGGKVEKLLLTHNDKHNYVIHARLLQFYMSLGAIVTKIHRAVSFHQDKVFAQYIDGNTEKRAKATTTFGKDFYKLKNNSLFGKTMENIRKRTNLRLCNTPEKLVTYSSKVTFRQSKVIDNDLVAAILSKDVICLDRPVYIGQAILDLSKLRMYELQYVELEKYRVQFNCELNIVAGDTDSFFLECRNVSLETQLLPAMIHDKLLDTSNYPKSHKLYSREIASVVGKFKDESCGVRKFDAWLFLRPKCYVLKDNQNDEVKKAKGVKRSLVKSTLTYEDYLRVYNAPPDDVSASRCVKQARIGSINHQLYTMVETKTALNAIDNKRYWISKNHSVAYGHEVCFYREVDYSMLTSLFCLDDYSRGSTMKTDC
jgi:hypothetical protein